MTDAWIYKDTRLKANSFRKIDPVTKKSVAFLGWSLSPDGPVVYQNKDLFEYSYDLNGKIVYLYAKWADD